MTTQENCGEKPVDELTTAERAKLAKARHCPERAREDPFLLRAWRTLRGPRHERDGGDWPQDHFWCTK